MGIWGAFWLPFFCAQNGRFWVVDLQVDLQVDLHFSKTGLAKVG